MTNQEAAAYFAQLPPNDFAVLAVANVDILGAVVCPLRLFTEEDAAHIDDGSPRDFVGRICLINQTEGVD